MSTQSNISVNKPSLNKLKSNTTLKQNTNTITTNEQAILNKLNDALHQDKTQATSSNTSKNTLLNKNFTSKDKSNNKDFNVIDYITPDMENYSIIIGVITSFVVLFLMFFMSKTFNVGRTVERLKMFERYQKITNYKYRNKNYGNLKLKEVSMLSSFNSTLNNGQMLTYSSEQVLKQIIKSGARFLEFNIFASKFGIHGKPVVSNGYKNGEWKLTLNTTPFENVISTISDNAFTVLSESGGSPNPNDPIFISLNLSTGYNLYCLDLMADILLDYFSERLLDPKYAFQFSNNLHNIKMTELENKVVILASNGFEGSKLEEIINGVWTDETVITKDNPNLISIPEYFTNYNVVDDDYVKPEKKYSNKLKNEIKTDNNVLTKSIINRNITNYTGLEDGEIEESISKLDNNNVNDNKLHKELKLQLSNKLIEEKENKKKQEKFMNNLNNLYDIFKEDSNNTNNNKKRSKSNKRAEEDFTDDGIGEFENTELNDSSNTNIGNNKSTILRITSQMFNKPEFNGDRIKNHNRNGLTIVVPNIEGDIFNQNHDPTIAFKLGCQFVCMNFQYINEAMDIYITKFENNGIIPINKLVK